jgi:hypothetical protein
MLLDIKEPPTLTYDEYKNYFDYQRYVHYVMSSGTATPMSLLKFSEKRKQGIVMIDLVFTKENG